MTLKYVIHSVLMDKQLCVVRASVVVTKRTPSKTTHRLLNTRDVVTVLLTDPPLITQHTCFLSSEQWLSVVVPIERLVPSDYVARCKRGCSVESFPAPCMVDAATVTPPPTVAALEGLRVVVSGPS